MDTIFEATKRRCIGEQNEQSNSHYNAVWHLNHGLVDDAIVHQRNAAGAYDEMWMRLERLLGIA